MRKLSPYKNTPNQTVPLPKKQNRREADLDSRVAKAVERKHPHKNWALEVKLWNNKLARHQKAALNQVENGKFLHKLPDQGNRQPFDYIKLGDADAIVCVIQENLRDVVCEVNNIFSFNVRI